MKKTCIFTESAERTHVLVTQIKTKAGKWIDYEKTYSQSGFEAVDYVTRYFNAFAALAPHYTSNSMPQVRILNGMRKQVFSSAAHEIAELFGAYGSDPFDRVATPCIDYRDECNFGADVKIASIRFKDSELADMLIMNINEQDGWDMFVKVLQDISFKNDGFKSAHTVAPSEEDNNLIWFKVKCYSGLQFSVALYI